jgi:hypothetical protein
MKEIIFIGNDFYTKSNKRMSPVYEKLPDGTFKRYDFGFMTLDLEKGQTVTIRPANGKEKKFFNAKLNGTL